MFVFNEKKIIYLLPLALLVLSEIYILFNPQLFYIVLALSFLLIALATRGLASTGRSFQWPLFLYFPLILFVSSSFYITLISSLFWIQLLLVLIIYLLYLYFRNLYYFFRYEAKERADKLDTFLTVGSVLSVFFTVATIYALPVYLGWSFWFLAVLLALVVFPLFSQSFLISPLNTKKNIGLFVVAWLIFMQIAVSVYLFTFEFKVLALISTLAFYLLMLILRLYLRDKLEMRLLRLPLLSSLFIFIILLLTSPWF